MVTATPTAFMPRVKWSWLWGSRKTDVAWTFMPFWAGLVLAVALYLTTGTGVMNQTPAWSLNLFGHHIHIAGLLLYVYGPLIDAPHLWATIARTYTDREEWAQLGIDGIKEKMNAEVKAFYNRKEQQLGSELMAQLERFATLQVIDDKWKEHLREMDDLKEGIDRGVKEVPAFFINDEPFTGKPTFANLSAAIDAMLKKARKKTVSKQRA